MADARLLRKPEVLAMLGVSASTLHRWQQAGIVPPPLPGTARWDRLAIERALDHARGVAEPSPPTLSERAAKWVRSRCA